MLPHIAAFDSKEFWLDGRLSVVPLHQTQDGAKNVSMGFCQILDESIADQ